MLKTIFVPFINHDMLINSNDLTLFYREFKVTNNSVDIGIKSAAGLRPKVLTQQEIQPDPES